MAFLQGTFSAQRFHAPRPTNCVEEDLLASLVNLNFNRTRAGEDGVHVGWGGGEHKYDHEVSCDKNLRGEFLHFAFRVTKFAPPADEVKAVYLTELKGVLDAAGVQVPTAKMKREAREAAQSLIEEKGKDGRYDRHTLVPVVWDGKTGQVWYGSASHGNAGRFMALFAETFNVDLTPITAGSMAGDGVPHLDVEPAFGDAPAWCSDGFDWLGNEFGLWCLWRQCTSDGEDKLGSAPAVMRRLTVACPNGVYGSDTFTCEVPVVLPEFKSAIAEGRLPRAMGLQFPDDVSFTLDPEVWAVTGAKVPELEDVPPGPPKDVQRLEQCREVFRSLDALYGEFLAVRLNGGWAEVVGQINQWTGRVPAEVG